MVQRGERLRLPREARHAIRIARKGGRQELQRDVAIQLGVARPIDLAHTPGTERGEDLVRPEHRSHSQHTVTPISNSI